MENTYLDLVTNKVRPRHKEWGNSSFIVPSNEWQVGSFSELIKACKDARTRGGGSIFINGDILCEDTVLWPDRMTAVYDGNLIATGSSWKDQQHFTSVKKAENLIFVGTTWDGRGKPILCCPIGDSENIAFVDTVHHSCKTGPAAEKSRRMAFIGISSFGHTHWHGLNPGQDEDCTEVVVLSCNLHDNNAYGLDYHGSKMEVAGCRIWNNGLTGSYLGACVKFPRGRDIWLHDCELGCKTEGLGLVFIYEMKGLAPSDIYVYRNKMTGADHFRIPKPLTIYHADNTYDRDVSVLGGGNLVYNDMLTFLPDEVPDRTTPVEPPDDGKGWTEEELIALIDGRIREAFLSIANDI